MEKRNKKNTNTPQEVPNSPDGRFLTTNQGVRISDNHNSLKVGPRGPTLMEDFILREKITHFDHERIPERIVHARGAGAFGVFECTKDMSKYTTAGFLTQVGKKTKVLTRFSTVAGSRGSMDTARDVRGFSTKFYTDEGNYDLVGNNMPVFFIQDAMKFPDLVHAVKPEQDLEIPQASSAHDTFWDFISLMPESAHMIFWLMSDRAIPRSYRMMEGFGVHTFRFVNAEGVGTFVKLHWKPKLGVHALTWEEAMNLGGQDPDFHRRDLYENIKAGIFPQWDLGVQLIPEADEFKYSFDLLDPTKLIPEELVPVELIGRLELNRNPDNFFSEIEQAAFHPGHLVPGIDVTNDPLLQGRLFSYTDTQLIRLGGPNFHQLPVNRPIVPIDNNMRDGFGQQSIPKGPVAYEPNSIGGGCPFHAGADMKKFVHFAERVDAHKVRARSASFGDFYSQAKLFFNSQHPVEQDHIKSAFIFELSKVETEAVRERMLGIISKVDTGLAHGISGQIGVKIPQNFETPPNPAEVDNNIVPANRATEIAIQDDQQSGIGNVDQLESPALSMIIDAPESIEGRKFAIIIGDGADTGQIKLIKSALMDQGAIAEIVGTHMGTVSGVKVDKSLDIVTAFHYDGVLMPDGGHVIELKGTGTALRFLAQAFKQCKAIGIVGKAKEVFDEAMKGKLDVYGTYPGVAFDDSAAKVSKQFIDTAKIHREWSREELTINMPV